MRPLLALLVFFTGVCSAQLSKDQEKLKSEIVALFDASRNVNGDGSQAARRKIEASMDWDRVARDCLGPAEARRRAGKDFAAFRDLLKQVVTGTAYSRMESFWKDTTYEIDLVEIKGAEGHVRSKFTVKSEPFSLDYYLSRRGERWLIHDVAFEELRYSSNINEQIVAYLTEKSFTQLLASLRKRRDELASGKRKG